jgi:regulator of cell morphogenesis and NO signaling
MFQEEAKLNTEDLRSLTLSQIVKKNYKAAAVFERYSLDFCCRGNRPVASACSDAGVDTDNVLSELELLGNESEIRGFNPEEWNLDFLTDYIVNTHHQYILKMIPVISAHADKVATVHGKNHPETKDIARTFTAVYKDLKQHMQKEEQILFPFIKRLVLIKASSLKFEKPYFGTVENPIRMMEVEHQNAGDELYAIRELTNNYNPPADACNTYKILYQELKDFEEDLHRHVHLENNILFPKSTVLEKELASV